MKISTKGRYGLEALVDLALHASEGPVSLKSISERCGLSEAYILQIFLILRRAGIIESVRGAQGGYVLSRSPSEIATSEVLEALEGPLAPVSCLDKDCSKPCDRIKICATRILWEKIRLRLINLTESITLADLVNAYFNVGKGKEEYKDYSI